MLIGFPTGVGFLNVWTAGYIQTFVVGQQPERDWFPDFIYSGGVDGGVSSRYVDYLPSYFYRVINGKPADGDNLCYEIIFRIQDNDVINKVIRGSTRDAFLTWFKRNVGSETKLRPQIEEMIRIYRNERYSLLYGVYSAVYNHNGFPNIYIDLKEWLDKCK